MAWPPPTLATNRSDATPQQTTHPADHNQANQAINDIVAKVTAATRQPATSGGAFGLGTPITSGILLASTPVAGIPVAGDKAVYLLVYHSLIYMTAGGPFDVILQQNSTGSYADCAMWRMNRGGGSSDLMVDGVYQMLLTGPVPDFTVRAVASSVPGGTAAQSILHGSFHYISFIRIPASS